MLPGPDYIHNLYTASIIRTFFLSVILCNSPVIARGKEQRDDAAARLLINIRLPRIRMWSSWITKINDTWTGPFSPLLVFPLTISEVSSHVIRESFIVVHVIILLAANFFCRGISGTNPASTDFSRYRIQSRYLDSINAGPGARGFLPSRILHCGIFGFLPKRIH